MTEMNELESKRKILIVDDSELNREMLTDILGDDYEYIYAQDGARALELISENLDIDMLLLDMNMPKLGGMQVLKAMREQNWLDEIPVVIISAENDDGFIKNAYYLGATDYIVRPFSAFLVQHRVKNTLMMYSQKKQLVRMVESQVFRRERINNMLIAIFSHVVEIGNSESSTHTRNVQTLTNMLLQSLVKNTDVYSLTEEDISLISAFSALHDIGKMLVPTDILNKPGKLTDEEWEIMKKHTVYGDELLNGINVEQDEKLLRIVHDICRHHHERYDGSGYPDGLMGDRIPISAQVVSLADVYDALTSERCYKKAYTHEQAVRMIANGECGEFNPLLLQCFLVISDELYINLNLNNGKYDVEENTYLLTSEALENEALSAGERYSSRVEAQKAKTEFFADRCVGIQFEYDAVLRKTVYIRYYNELGERVLLQSNAVSLLCESDNEKLNELVMQATKESPDIVMEALVPIGGDLRWHKLTVRTIWTSTSSSYIGLVGQFTDIHDKVLGKSTDFIIDDKVVTGEMLLTMCEMFDVVRVVDPNTCVEMNFGSNGEIVASEKKCYELWKRSEPCKNCSSSSALESKKWNSKLEIKDGVVYSVLSRYIRSEEHDYVLEVAFSIDDSSEKLHDEIGFYPDSMALKNYYKDTLTKTYSRAYLDSFLPNLENAKGIAIADIDEFKSINDTYGHIVGDAALKHISSVIKDNIRREDVLIRYGGDEFLIIFDNISEADFFEKLKSIKKAVHDSVFEEYPEIKHDISIGGAYDVRPFEKAVDTADKAMYKDKFQNKNWGK